MNENGQDKVIAFDTLFTNNHIQMLKILMPYFDRSMQKTMAVYIKYLEFQHTITFFQRHPDAALPGYPQEKSFDLPKLCREVVPYCAPKDRSRLESMGNMLQTFEQYKEMMEMVQMMKDLFPEGEGSMDSDFMASMAGMPGMGDRDGMDPMAMFEMFQSMTGGGFNGDSEQGSAQGSEPGSESKQDSERNSEAAGMDE